MAEFSEVCKQWRRMCDSFGDKACQSYRPCAEQCPVGANPVCGELREASADDIKKFETAVMAWAAEHKELVYPTWAEYLREIGVLKKYEDKRLFEMPDGSFESKVTGSYEVFDSKRTIPADIAQKLGIEPKEEST